MKCFNKLNDHHGLCGALPPTSPRISFSNDFTLKPPTPSSPTASDQDFEFAVGSRPMIAADELFFKGRMLPLLDPPQPPVSSRAITPLDEVGPAMAIPKTVPDCTKPPSVGRSSSACGGAARAIRPTPPSPPRQPPWTRRRSRLRKRREAMEQNQRRRRDQSTILKPKKSIPSLI